MKCIKLLFLMMSFVFMLCATNVHASDSISKNASFLCHTVLNGKSYNYKKHFSEQFRAKLPKKVFQKLTRDLIDTAGKCVQFKLVQQKQNIALYQFISSKKRVSEISFQIDEAGALAGLLVKGIRFNDISIENADDLKKYLSSLDGKHAVLIESFNGSKNISYRAGSRHPIGSAFKLYVLGSLVDELKAKRFPSWETRLPVFDRWKSLPSGVMHNWNEGRMVTLRDFAEKMISISDNTATDHLIYFLGRDTVEKQLTIMKNDFVLDNKPFLTTLEMFKLKWAVPQEYTKKFTQSNEDQKRNNLNEIFSKFSRADIGKNGVHYGTPYLTNELEWFASTRSMCNAMKSLKNKKDKTALGVLSKNTPFLDKTEKSHWKYQGYKGGFEPGVLAFVYLLQSKKGNWGCVSVLSHNKTKGLNQFVIFDLVEKTLNLAKKTIR